MKTTYKTIFIAFLSLLLLFSTLIPAFAAENVENLPHIAHWVNGKAAGEDDVFIYNTWAVDDTDVSDSKYVLLNQEGMEVLRIKNYPQDINNGEDNTLKTYVGELTLKRPKGVDSEIIVTLENKDVLYYVYFNEQNDYKVTRELLPGVYTVTYVDVVTDTESNYAIKDDFKLVVKEKPVTAKLEVVKIKSDSKKVEKEDKSSENSRPIPKNFDSNGDLLGDTIRLCIFVIILFSVYLFIKRKREKEQEINKKS